MAQVVFEHLTFTYPGQTRPALQEVSFSVEAGSFLLLCGPSGCGKTTLLRHLKPALMPVGTRQGWVLLDGVEPSALPAAQQASMIAYVGQDPESQLVTDKVWHELAFGLENLGCPPEVIRRRVAEMASFFGITDWFRRDVATLSGGQKQLVNLAAAMTLRPSILLLDEPTSQLDPIAAGRFLDAVGRIHRELGTTILLSEHRLEEAFSMADRVLVLQDGALCCDAPPSDAAAALADGVFVDALPTPARIWAAVAQTGVCPVTVSQGRHWLREYAAAHPLSPLPSTSAETPLGEAAAVLDKVWFRYTREGDDVLRGLCLRAAKGQVLALLGGNGAGKTTTLQLLSGVRKPYRGGVTVSGKVCLLPQNPRSLFLRRTLGEDLQETASAVGSGLLPQLCARCRIAGLLTRHPDDLSGGELQRAALCKLLLLQPEVLLLDEPTKGLDAPFKAELAAMLRQLTASGTAVVLVSHDLEFCAQYADRCALLFDGQVVSEDATRRFFAQNRFYTTAAARMAQPLLPEAMTAADVIAACGGTLPEPPQILPEPPECLASSGSESPSVPAPKPVGKGTGRSRFLAGALLLAMPLTLLLGSTLLDNRRYLFISLLLVLEALATAVVRMEGRRPAARELAVLAAMCALAVLGRTAFFMLPQFKPLLALVILTGMAFGAEAGFLVGAAAMLISDMLLGQGPWTPYQMVAAGLVGALAGGLTRMGILSRGRIGMCLYGALSTLVIYGGILNPVSLLLFQPNPTVAMVLAAYAAGLPMDLIHAASTACFLALIGPVVLEKLDRLRVKYGI